MAQDSRVTQPIQLSAAMSPPPYGPAVRRILKHRSRQFRNEPTPAEAALWEILRNRKVAGLKFRRQQRLQRFVADFFCAEIKLVVEIDGPVHAANADRDAVRQEVLERGGLTFLRLTNSQILESPKYAIARIVETAQARRAKPF